MVTEVPELSKENQLDDLLYPLLEDSEVYISSLGKKKIIVNL